MPPMKVSHPIFACLLLILLSQYGETKTKAQYFLLESILATLERIEKVMKRSDHEYGCVVPCKLLNPALHIPKIVDEILMTSDHATLLNELNDQERRSLEAGGHIHNMNNLNFGHVLRRNFDESLLASNKIANQNVNM